MPARSRTAAISCEPAEVEPGRPAGVAAPPGRRPAPGPRPRGPAGPARAGGGRARAPGPRDQQAAVRLGRAPPGPSRTRPSPPPTPNRFLPAGQSRRPERGSPSKLSTTSTACSSVRGPARSPAFVTWPQHHRDALLLGEPDEGVRAQADLGRPAGSASVPALRMVWIESTASRTAGRSRRRPPSPRRGRDRGGTRTSPSATPAAGPGPATWAATPRPRRSGRGTRQPTSAHTSWRRRVDLPMPGSPASSTTEPATSPPPSTRSRSGNPVRTRSISASPTEPSGSAAEGPAATAGGRETSWTVPHPPHAAHRPSHWAACCPQSRHANTVVDLATAEP